MAGEGARGGGAALPLRRRVCLPPGPTQRLTPCLPPLSGTLAPQALSKLETKPPVALAAALEGASDVSDVEMSASSEDEGAAAEGGSPRALRRQSHALESAGPGSGAGQPLQQARVTVGPLGPAQRRMLRALAVAVHSVASDAATTTILRQAQLQAAQSHAAFASAVPDWLLVPADSPEAPGAVSAAAARTGGKNSKGKPAAGSARGVAASRLASVQVPQEAAVFASPQDLPQYRANLEAHST